MQCPRCGVSVFADLNACRDCGWLLAKPYAPANSRAATSVELVEPVPAPPVNGKRPWQQLLWGPFAPARSFRISRRRHARHEPANALAELGSDAYFAPRPRAIECLEMPLVQTSLDFAGADAEEEVAAAQRVAPLPQRLRAGLHDAALIVGSTAAFFTLFTLLGGRLGLARRDLLIYGLATFALACLYFGLFTYLGGRTPGMHRYGLVAVRFDGGPMDRAEARLRAFGYVVSTGSLLLGFLWAVADEHTLTWHDRISRTLLVRSAQKPKLGKRDSKL